MYPDLNNFRRSVVPWFEKNEQSLFNRDIMFSKEAQNVSYAGVVHDATVEEVIERLKQHPNVYATNLAALKWRIGVHGNKVYERASYSYRPGGFFGKYQYHFRLWPHLQGTAVWAHFELNPWHSPRKHYAGHEWNPSKGVSKAREWLDIDETLSAAKVYGG